MTTAREPIDELVHGFAHGRLTRREFIVRMLALGVSMGAIGPIIAACGGAPRRRAPPGGPPLRSPRGLRAAARKSTASRSP